MERGNTRRTKPTAAHALLIATIAALALPAAAAAVCSVVPVLPPVHASAVGSVSQPYASPGDWLMIAPDGCGGGAAALPDAKALVMTVVFKPQLVAGPTPLDAPPPAHVVVLASGAECAARTCPGIPTTCLPCVGAGDTTNCLIVDGDRLLVRFPDPGLGAELTGPVAIAVTDAGDATPCALVHHTCREEWPRPLGKEAPIACVDELFVDDGAFCSITPTVNDTFPHLTALPSPNNYSALSLDRAAEKGSSVKLALDRDGNALVPVDWSGVLEAPKGDSVPVARLVRAVIALDGFSEGKVEPLLLPDDAFLAAFTERGAKLPPILDAQLDQSEGDALVLFGSADGRRSVLRIARRSPTFLACVDGSASGTRCREHVDCPAGACGMRTCVGGAAAGRWCMTDAECGSGVCRDGLFDLRSRRLRGGAGPVALAVGRDVEAGVAGSAPLDGVLETNLFRAFVVDESLGLDVNGDYVFYGSFVVLQDRETGAEQVLESSGLCPWRGAQARAVTRVDAAPFGFPAAAVEHDILAFLEPEAGGGKHCDANGDGDVLDAILRVFRFTPGAGAKDLTAKLARPIIVDPAPVVAGRSLAISDGLVFFREAGGAASVAVPVGMGTEVPSTSSSAPALSGDGRHVAFVSTGNGTQSVWVRDLKEPSGWSAPELVSGEVAANTAPSISDDGNRVAFYTNSEIRVHDRQAGLTVVVDVPRRLADAEPFQWLNGGRLSADGRVVVFSATYGQKNPHLHSELFAFDVHAAFDDSAAASVPIAQHIATGLSGLPAVSADGRVVVYAVPDGRGIEQVMVHDRDRHAAGTAEIASVSSSGVVGDGESSFPIVSRDGNFVAFRSLADNLTQAPGVFKPYAAYVRDRRLGTTRVFTGYWGGEPRGISDDGRAVAFRTIFNWGVIAIADFERDVAAPVIESSHLRQEGSSILSRDGRVVAFQGVRAGSVPGWDAPTDVYLRALEPDGASRLRVFDTASGTLVEPGVTATEVAVAGGAAAFLGPEADAGDGRNSGDSVVHLWAHGRGRPLDRIATSVAMAPCVVAALVRDPAPGVAGPQAGGETAAAVLQLCVAGASGGAGCAWTTADLPCTWVVPTRAGRPVAAERLAVHGSVAAFLTPEAAQRGQGAGCTPEGGADGTDLNEDEDCRDRVLQLVRLPTTPSSGTPSVVNVGVAAEDFVLGGTPGAELIAFRVDEQAEGKDLNGDADLHDDVLQVYAVAGDGVLINSRSAVSPCRFHGCDARVPYRVGAHTVTFLTLERDQGRDLDADGDGAYPDDLVLQLFNVRRALAHREADPVVARTVLSAVAAPTCVHATDQGPAPCAGAGDGDASGRAAPCAGDDDCAPGCWCRAALGGCVRERGACELPRLPADCGDGACSVAPDPTRLCPPGSQCEPDGGGSRGRCVELFGSCDSAAHCPGGLECRKRDLERFVSPLAPLAPSITAAAGQLSANTGVCIESIGPCPSAGECARGTCVNGSCEIAHGPPFSGNCPPFTTYRSDVVVATANDSDGDEIPDALDNCPTVPNPDQEDSTPADRGGDACRIVGLCGDGVVTHPFEMCDDGGSDRCIDCREICGSAPRSDCRPGGPGDADTVFSLDHASSRQPRLAWHWRHDRETVPKHFGNPRLDEGYAFCLYEGAPARKVFEVSAPPGGVCASGACWTTGETGGRFDFTRRSANGIARLRLSARSGQEAFIDLDAEGAAVDPGVTRLQEPVTVQLVNSTTGACWQAKYEAADVVTNSATAFRARGKRAGSP